MTTKTTLATHQALIAQLETCSVSNLLLEPAGQWLRFDFTSTLLDGPSFTVTLFNPVFWKFSRTPDDDGHYFVGEASLIQLEPGGREMLGFLGYDFIDEDGSVATYPTRSLFHFHIEGGIVVDAICEGYEVLQQT